MMNESGRGVWVRSVSPLTDNASVDMQGIGTEQVNTVYLSADELDVLANELRRAAKALRVMSDAPSPAPWSAEWPVS